MRLSAQSGEKSWKVNVEEEDGVLVVELDGTPYRVQLDTRQRPVRAAQVNGDNLLFGWWRHDATYEITFDSVLHDVTIEDALRAMAPARVHGGAQKGRGEVRAPIPGLIVSVAVAPGAEVAKGDVVLVLSAMKLENNITASASGTVSAVHVTPGQAVDKNDLMVVIE